MKLVDFFEFWEENVNKIQLLLQKEAMGEIISNENVEIFDPTSSLSMEEQKFFVLKLKLHFFRIIACRKICFMIQNKEFENAIIFFATLMFVLN